MQKEDIEVVADISAQKADPATPIPLPDLCTPTKAPPPAEESRGAEEVEAEKTAEKRVSLPCGAMLVIVLPTVTPVKHIGLTSFREIEFHSQLHWRN